jgi:hypothetical protein
MKKIFWVSMAVVALFCAGSLSAQEIKGPKIVVKEMEHDLGKVVQGRQADSVFEVRNAGNEPLIIDRVVPS